MSTPCLNPLINGYKKIRCFKILKKNKNDILIHRLPFAKVWIILIPSIPIIISTLYCINRLVAFEDTIVVRSVKRGSITSSDRLMKNVTAYVIGLILHQGTTVLDHSQLSNKHHRTLFNHDEFYVARYCSTKKISARFVAATWCLASLFIFTFYNVSMFSYITSYQPNKLISSANELVHRPDVYLLAQKGYNIESILKVLIS